MEAISVILPLVWCKYFLGSFRLHDVVFFAPQSTSALFLLPSSFYFHALTVSPNPKPNAGRRRTLRFPNLYLRRGPHPPPPSPNPQIRPDTSCPDPIRTTGIHHRLAPRLSGIFMGRLRSLITTSDLPLPLPTLRYRNTHRTHFPAGIRALRRPLIGRRSCLLVPCHALDWRACCRSWELRLGVLAWLGDVQRCVIVGGCFSVWLLRKLREKMKSEC